MPEDFKYDVFLSHSSEDKPVVRPIAERLKKDGLKVWFDDGHVEGSPAWFINASSLPANHK
ncbi:MAG: toll/interleukin-1 receptor domain-containing protein [Sedimentisphaerales bacterium]|nr:toll/interleukin-1 receptor domain-containing protein [Sedimentisphaerales bacterium]